MLQQFLDLVKENPGVTTGAGVGALFLSEALGFTKKGGILKALLDLIIAMGAAASAFKKVRRDLTEESPAYDKAFDEAFKPKPPEPPKE